MTRMKLNQISIRKLRAMLKATERAGFGDCQSVALIRREITRRQRPKGKELEDLKYIARAAKAFILESRKVGISIPLDLQDHFEDLSECFEDESEDE